MVVSDPSMIPVADATMKETTDPPPDHGRGGGPISRVLVGTASIALGCAALVVSLDVLTAGDGIARHLVGAVGVVLLHVGLSRIARRLAGPAIDLGFWLSVAWLTLLTAAAILADALPLSESRDVSAALTSPIRARPDLLSSHPLGTDVQGLDILGGILHGARVSLTVGFGAALIGMTLGLMVGIAAGYHRGRLDAVVSFATDSMLAFPPLVLLLAMVAALSPNVVNVTIALAVISVPTYVRLARANTLVFAQREFVLAARALGERNRSIMLRELLPNVLMPVVSFSFLLVAVFIVAEASLSFLGLSISRPSPTWGNMIAAGQDRFQDHPHLVFVPGTILFLTVFAFNRVGDRARRAWDPREAKL